jgi:hypothetical protein
VRSWFNEQFLVDDLLFVPGMTKLQGILHGLFAENRCHELKISNNELINDQTPIE